MLSFAKSSASRFRTSLSSVYDVTPNSGNSGISNSAGASGRVRPDAECFDVDLTSHLEPIDERTGRLPMARDHHAQLVGAGWSDVETDDYGTFRRMRGSQAELLIPAERHSPLRLSVQASPGSPSARGDEASLQLLFNDHPLDVQAFEAGWKRYDWDLAGDFVQAVNSIVLKAPAAGAEVADVLVRR